jgi:hypothetical protein
MSTSMATEHSAESLADILRRIEERYINPIGTPSAPQSADRPALRETRRTPHVRETHRVPWPLETTAIPAEVFLETLGFFIPSSKRIQGIYTKVKPVGTRAVADGTTHVIHTKISANHELGLPITADLDYSGRYEWEFRLQREPQAHDSVAWLDRFAALAQTNGVDPHAVFTALGGRPALDPWSPAAQAWRRETPPAAPSGLPPEP